MLFNPIVIFSPIFLPILGKAMEFTFRVLEQTRKNRNLKFYSIILLVIKLSFHILVIQMLESGTQSIAQQ